MTEGRDRLGDSSVAVSGPSLDSGVSARSGTLERVGAFGDMIDGMALGGVVAIGVGDPTIVADGWTRTVVALSATVVFRRYTGFGGSPPPNTSLAVLAVVPAVFPVPEDVSVMAVFGSWGVPSALGGFCFGGVDSPKMLLPRLSNCSSRVGRLLFVLCAAANEATPSPITTRRIQASSRNRMVRFHAKGLTKTEDHHAVSVEMILAV